MKKGAKAQLFTLDLLLALIPLTIALGMSASAMSGVATQMEDYIIFYSEQRVASDAADVLAKAPGEPYDWNIRNIQTLGFATQLGELGCGTGLSNTTLANILDTTKLSNFQQNPTYGYIPYLIYELADGNNIRIVVTNSTDTLVDVMGYYSDWSWNVTNDSAEISTVMAGVTDVHVTERPVGITTRPVDAMEVDYIFPLGGAIRSSPAVGDINNDGVREIVVGTDGADGTNDGKVYAFYPNGTVLDGWPYTTNYSNDISSPALADITGDGNLEVLIGDGDGNLGAGKGTLYAIKSDGTLLWSYEAADDIWTSPAVADIDGDTFMEIVFGGMGIDHNLTVLSHTGSVQWVFNAGSDPLDVFIASPAIGDIDNDNELEVVAGTCNGELYAFSGTGIAEWISPFSTAGCMYSSPALYDVHNNGGAEEIFAIAGDTLYALKDAIATAEQLWNQSVPNSYYSSPTIVDTFGDGNIQIVLGDRNNNLSAFNGFDGSRLGGYTVGGDVDSSTAIGDVDGDCVIEAVVGSDDGYLYVVNLEDGTLEYSYSTGAAPGAAIESSPIIADLDDDGILEIAFGNNAGNFYVISAAGSSGGEWQMFRQCLKRAGYYYDPACSGPLSSSVTEAIGEDAVSGNLKVYIWE